MKGMLQGAETWTTEFSKAAWKWDAGRVPIQS